MNRRHFFKLLASSIALLPLQSLLAKEEVCSVKKPKPGLKIIDPNGRVAKRVRYVANALSSKHKRYKKGMTCGNCKYYKPKKNEKDLGWAVCPMVSSFYVSQCGWCKSYRAGKKA